ncbi:speckle-type POZ protein-like [Parasteatoda tepidariorum]|uniref:speckle-type POZ protein-like n=1 Tax=Parasteatoda tepidariorum TaxID=114398 RepID=UPI001C71D51F|nr:speckle-type POZ protein-like [Parasteatoda tepidariorum]
MPSLFEYSESLTFPISDSNSVELTLNSTEEKMKILIHFKDDESESSQQLTCTLSLFDKIGCNLGSKRTGNVCKRGETWTFPDLITKEMLRCCETNSSRYEFMLKCDVCISRKTHTNSIERLKFVSPCSLKSIRRDIPIPAMQSNFRSIFLNQNDSDVTTRCKNDEFPAHRLVLKVRSPVFAAMFDQDMLENKTGVVDIADMDGKTLKAFLEFLYTDKVDKLDYDIAKNLILTADKYQVPSLVDMCASFLISIISIENVCEIIAIADMINCKNLKSFALNFIKVNAAKVLPTAA